MPVPFFALFLNLTRLTQTHCSQRLCLAIVWLLWHELESASICLVERNRTEHQSWSTGRGGRKTLLSISLENANSDGPPLPTYGG